MNWSRIVGVLSFVASLLTVGATFLQAVSPEWAVFVVALAGAINAFTGRIQGHPTEE